MSTQPPVTESGHTITSPRLITRTAVPSDGEAVTAYFSNPANFPWEVEPDLTLEKVLPRIDRWAKATEEGRSAFMVIVERESNQLVGFGGYNNLPYTEPLASAPPWEMTQKEGPEEGRVLAADIGMSIDHRYQRRGYAREAVCSAVEYAFEVLGAGYVHMDTAKDNWPFRGLMSDVGIEGVEGDGGETPEGLAFKLARKSCNYRFDRATWDGAKEEMKKGGKWPL